MVYRGWDSLFQMGPTSRSLGPSMQHINITAAFVNQPLQTELDYVFNPRNPDNEVLSASGPYPDFRLR